MDAREISGGRAGAAVLAMPRLRPRPMSQFDPSKRSMVHDALNDKTFPWEPENYLEHYRGHARKQSDGVVGWDGLLLDGWYEVE